MRNRVALTAFVGTALILIGAGHSHAANPLKSPKTGKAATIRGPMFLTKSDVTTTWTMPNLCASYKFPKNLTGGAVIGIAEFGGGYFTSDLTLFSKTYMNGVPINITPVSVDGTVNDPGFDPDTDAEVALDIQIASAAYYYCTGKAPTVKVFFCSQGVTTDDFVNNNAKVIAAAAAAGCDVLSISYGLPEDFISSNTSALNLEAAAAAASAKGMAIFASSGDGDATDGRQDETDGKNHVSLPSSCPHIIAVGGTSKTTSSEVVWNNGFSLGTSYPLGTGGGYSIIFPAQSFQIGAPKAPTTNNGLGRMVPDVAANADPNTPYDIAYYGEITGAGNGTSAASPLWAGLIAASGKKLGFITPTLWLSANRKAFQDITQGNNGLFNAAVGPDACTGLGAPIGTSIAAIFQPTTVITPSNVTAVFNSATKTLMLTGDSSANALTVSYQAGTLTVTGANGTKINNSTSYTISVTGQIILNATLNDGNDAISLIGVDASAATISMGTGNDAAAFTLCNITLLTFDGGTGTDSLVSTSSVVGKSALTNYP